MCAHHSPILFLSPFLQYFQHSSVLPTPLCPVHPFRKSSALRDLLGCRWCTVKEKNHTTAQIVTIRSSWTPPIAEPLMKHGDSNRPWPAPLLDPSNLCHSHHPLCNLRIPHSQKKMFPLISSRNVRLYKLPESTPIHTIPFPRQGHPLRFCPGSLPSKPCFSWREKPSLLSSTSSLPERLLPAQPLNTSLSHP